MSSLSIQKSRILINYLIIKKRRISLNQQCSNLLGICQVLSREIEYIVGIAQSHRPGKSYNLFSFQEMADKFEAKWAKENKCFTKKDKEKEYWKIIEDADVCFVISFQNFTSPNFFCLFSCNFVKVPVQVMYGSDIDSSVTGSGFPLNPNSAVPSNRERALKFQKKCLKLYSIFKEGEEIEE